MKGFSCTSYGCVSNKTFCTAIFRCSKNIHSNRLVSGYMFTVNNRSNIIVFVCFGEKYEIQNYRKEQPLEREIERLTEVSSVETAKPIAFTFIPCKNDTSTGCCSRPKPSGGTAPNV